MPPEQRRAAIIEAVRPLLIEHGQAVTVRQIAAAACVAEGTIFGVFADKDELIAAVVEHVVDNESFEKAISNIDRQAPFEERLVLVTELLQARVVDVWQLLSSIGDKHRAKHARGMPESAAMIELLAVEPDRFRVDPIKAARMLRGLTLSLSHPMLATEPASATEIVDMLLHGAGAAGPPVHGAGAAGPPVHGAGAAGTETASQKKEAGQ